MKKNTDKNGQYGQLQIEEVKIPPKACAFTGHRILEEDFSVRTLKKHINGLIKQGVDTFYCGMAMGFDLVAAESVLTAKKKNPQIKLVACIPCDNQEKGYSQEDKKRYRSMLEKADKKRVLSETYYRGCMLVRDRYMADRADVLIAYCKRDTGGTAYTVKYFTKKKPFNEIIFL